MERQSTYECVVDHNQNFHISSSSELYQYIENNITGTDIEKWLLKDTGFEVTKQLEMYIKMRQIDECSIEEINRKFFERTKADLLGFYWEFLKGSPVLPNPLFINQEQRMVWGKKYGPLIEASSPYERDGVPYSTIRRLNDQLVNSKRNMTYVFASPSGWAGNGLEHPESQYYIYHINEIGDLSALTLRVDLSLDEHEKLLFGKAFPQKTQRERIKNIVSFVSFENSTGTTATETAKLLRRIERVSGRNIAWENKEKNGKLIKRYTFDDVREVLRNIDSLYWVEEEIDSILISVENEISQEIDWLQPDNLKRLILSLGKAADRMLVVVKPEVGNAPAEKRIHVMTQLQGCVGGKVEGMKKMIDGKVHYFVLRCGKCGVSINKFIPAGYRCSNCGGVYLGC